MLCQSKIHATSWAHPNEDEVVIKYVYIQLTMFFFFFFYLALAYSQGLGPLR